jgi:phosphoribosylamine---glycine ligase
MRVLLVGGGGREHALAWRLAQDDPSVSITAAPGNPGIAELAECLPIAATDVEALARLARERRVDLTLVGPETPLAAGIVDRFRTDGLPIFGPTRAAAEIETSKSFAKTIMHEAAVPTARAIVCTEVKKAKAAVRSFGAPVVIKATGLAAGKGVVVCQTIAEADATIDEMIVGRRFGVASSEVLVEEFMSGEELSVLAICDGERALPLVPAQDHKRLLDGDQGPNTGGMGAYAPVSIATTALMSETMDRVFTPTLATLKAHGRPFSGLLYAGLMLTSDGPKVVEFNCRFGDPETQVVLPVTRLTIPFPELLALVARGERIPDDVAVAPHGAAVSTVVAARGYPEQPALGASIRLPAARKDVLIFHAGTSRDATGALVTAGGRVFSVTGLGRTFGEACKRSRDAAAEIAFDGRQLRSDIGWRELERNAGAT